MIKRRNLDPSLVNWLQSVGALEAGMGEIFHVTASPSSTNQYYSYLRTRVPDDRLFTNVKTAYDAMTAYRNDTMLVYPGTHDPGDKLTWSKNWTHMVGVGPAIKTQNPVKISHTLVAADTTGQFALTGNGCRIKNVCFDHKGVAQSVINVEVTGDDNYWENVQFLNMNDAATADEAGMLGVRLNAALNNTFVGCIFGGTETERTDGAADLTIGPGTCDNLFFYDCMWIADLDSAADADHAFIEFVANADLAKFMYLENPTFVNCGAAAALPDAITVAADLAGEVVLRNPMVVSITDIADNEEKVWILGDRDTTPGKFAGIAIHPDVS